MKEIKLADALWLKCLNEEEAFNKLEDLLKDGYSLEDSQGLGILLKKHKDKIIITYLDIYENIHKLEDFKNIIEPSNLVRPNYNETFLNVIGEIQKHFGGESIYPTNEIVNKYLETNRYKHVIVLLLDGLGTAILNHHLPKDAFLRKYYKDSLVSIYPSTTAAATTAIKNGLEPRVSCWTGWENYIKEAKRDVILFTGEDYFTDEATGLNLFKILEYKPFYEGLNARGFIVEPDFKKKINLKNELKRAKKNIKENESTIQYVYTTEPDSSLHVYGLASREVNRVILDLNKKVERFAKGLKPDTLLIVTADHGHRDVKPIRLDKCSILMDMLERRPANDARAMAFKVKEEYIDEFPIIFTKLFGSIYEIHKSSELLAKGYFGNSKITHERLKDFLGDYFALGINDYYFIYKEPTKAPFKSHHAGITDREMYVPLIVYGGEDEDIINK